MKLLAHTLNKCYTQRCGKQSNKFQKRDTPHSTSLQSSSDHRYSCDSAPIRQSLPSLNYRVPFWLSVYSRCPTYKTTRCNVCLRNTIRKLILRLSPTLVRLTKSRTRGNVNMKKHDSHTQIHESSENNLLN